MIVSSVNVVTVSMTIIVLQLGSISWDYCFFDLKMSTVKKVKIHTQDGTRAGSRRTAPQRTISHGFIAEKGCCKNI